MLQSYKVAAVVEVVVVRDTAFTFSKITLPYSVSRLRV